LLSLLPWPTIAETDKTPENRDAVLFNPASMTELGDLDVTVVTAASNDSRG
jgi:hypothetical protein